MRHHHKTKSYHFVAEPDFDDSIQLDVPENEQTYWLSSPHFKGIYNADENLKEPCGELIINYLMHCPVCAINVIGEPEQVCIDYDIPYVKEVDEDAIFLWVDKKYFEFTDNLTSSSTHETDGNPNDEEMPNWME